LLGKCLEKMMFGREIDPALQVRFAVVFVA
jgi:hypothetical protein